MLKNKDGTINSFATSLEGFYRNLNGIDRTNLNSSAGFIKQEDVDKFYDDLSQESFSSILDVYAISGIDKISDRVLKEINSNPSLLSERNLFLLSNAICENKNRLDLLQKYPNLFESKSIIGKITPLLLDKMLDGGLKYLDPDSLTSGFKHSFFSDKCLASGKGTNFDKLKRRLLCLNDFSYLVFPSFRSLLLESKLKVFEIILENFDIENIVLCLRKTTFSSWRFSGFAAYGCCFFQNIFRKMYELNFDFAKLIDIKSIYYIWVAQDLGFKLGEDFKNTADYLKPNSNSEYKNYNTENPVFDIERFIALFLQYSVSNEQDFRTFLGNALRSKHGEFFEVLERIFTVEASPIISPVFKKIFTSFDSFNKKFFSVLQSMSGKKVDNSSIQTIETALEAMINFYKKENKEEMVECAEGCLLMIKLM